jgi:octaprenyl-diphosphate synthase
LELDESAYLSIVRGKTAELTAVSCRLGAHYAGAPEETVEALASYGRDLGVAFQITDDVLDLWGEERTTGKTLGTDLEQQKLTLPLIRLLRTVPAETADTIRGHLSDTRTDRRRALRPYLEASGSLDYAWECAQEFASRATAALDVLSESTAKTVLRSLATFIVRRTA